MINRSPMRPPSFSTGTILCYAPASLIPQAVSRRQSCRKQPKPISTSWSKPVTSNTLTNILKYIYVCIDCCNYPLSMGRHSSSLMQQMAGWNSVPKGICHRFWSCWTRSQSYRRVLSTSQSSRRMWSNGSWMLSWRLKAIWMRPSSQTYWRLVTHRWR